MLPLIPPPEVPAQIQILNIYNKTDPSKFLPKFPSKKPLISLAPQQTLSDSNQSSASILGSPISVGIEPQYSVTANTNIHKSTQRDKTIVLRAWARKGRLRTFTIANQPQPIQPQTNESKSANVVEIYADQQEYDQKQQIIKAKGKVVMRFAKGVLVADTLQVNMKDRVLVAQGNVTLKRGEQTLRGDRFEYYFVEDRGVILNASGEIYQKTINTDISNTATNTIIDQPLSDRLRENQPLQGVTGTEGYKVVGGNTEDFNLLGGNTETGGTVNRLRFQAERLDFDGESWQATNIRLTNDPFSPPELEVRANTAFFKKIGPGVSQLTTTNSRIVLDQNTSLPIFQDTLTFDQNDRQPAIIQIGYDGDELGGLFIERTFSVVDNPNVTFQITPQYLIQKALFPGSFDDSQENEGDGSVISPSVFGLKSKLNAQFNPRTKLETKLTLTSLDLEQIDDNLRAKIQVQHKIGNLDNPYTISVGYNYRERLFNGSLGFQTVQDSIGIVVTSPEMILGDTGIKFSYQGAIQNIDAETDVESLLSDNSDNDLINLTRFQGAVFLRKDFPLWQGQALAPTPDQGLRYSPVPILPYVQITSGVTGVGSYYSNGDNQPSLSGSIGLEGQFGHFSRNYFDYTGFKISYSDAISGDASPFLFDRFVDKRTLSLGITQQIYGPIRFGFYTSFNLDSDDDISTDYFLEYNRRTHSVVVRYNPVLSLGSISLQISDFNWMGNPNSFDGSGVVPVRQGVSR